MFKYYISIPLIFTVMIIEAQEISNTISSPNKNKPLSSASSASESNVYPINIGPLNIPSFEEYFISAEIAYGDNFKITVSYQNNKDTTETFIVSPFTESLFNNYFSTRFSKLLNFRKDVDAQNLYAKKDADGTMKQIIQSLYLAIKVGELATIQNTFEPSAAEICLNKIIKVYKWTSETNSEFESIKKNGQYQIDPDKAFNQYLEKKNKMVDSTLASYYKIADQIKILNKNYSEISKKLDKSNREIVSTDSILQRLPNLNKKKSDIINIQDNLLDKITNLKKFYNTQIKKFPIGTDTIWFLKDKTNCESWLSITKSVAELEIKHLKSLIRASEDSVQIFKIRISNLKDSSFAYIESNQKPLIDYSESIIQNQEALYHLEFIKTLVENYNILKNELIKIDKNKRDSEVDLDFYIKERDEYKKLLDSIQINLSGLAPAENTAYYIWLQAVDEVPALEFEVEKVEIEFNEGLIENIIVVGSFISYNLVRWNNNLKSSQRQRIKFENKYPLGFSRKKDFIILQNQSLYAKYERNTLIMPIEHLISIVIQKHEVNRRDFSPQNQIFSFDKNSTDCQILKKDATYRLFEAKVYSDFIGLDAGAPNGIIQTEIGRRINVRTQRRFWKEKSPSPSYKYGDIIRTNGLFRKVPINAGFLTYIEPSLALTKIEDDGKYLPLNIYTDTVNIGGQDSLFKRYYGTTIDFRRFENLNASLKINWAVFDLPNWKSSFSINSGIQFAKVSLRDSLFSDGKSPVGLAEVKSINTFSILFEAPWEIKADERYGFCFSIKTQYYSALNSKFIQTGSIPEFGKPKPVSSYFLSSEKWLSTVELGGYFNPWPYSNSRSKFFFRYRLTWENNNPKHNFTQAQFGFSAYLVKK